MQPITCQRHACTLFTVVQPRYETDRPRPISSVPRVSGGKDSTMRPYLVLALFFLKKIYSYSYFCVYVCVSGHHLCVVTCGGMKRVLHPLQLELQVDESHLTLVLGTEPNPDLLEERQVLSLHC